MTMNGDSEWNQWRGETTAILRLLRDEVSTVRRDVESIKQGLWTLQAKSGVYGGIAGIIVSILIKVFIK